MNKIKIFFVLLLLVIDIIVMVSGYWYAVYVHFNVICSPDFVQQHDVDVCVGV